MANGYIYLQRKIQNCWIWQNESFSRGQAWIDLLLLAEWKDRKKRIGNELVTIKRGSFHLSILILADRWKWSRNRVRRFLEILEDDNMITTERTPHGTTVTIVKYEDYQVKWTPDEPTHEPSNEPTDEPTGEPQMNKDNKDNKNNKKEKRLIKPSVEEVKAYCQERNNGVDAQKFIDFYESKGWMIGKNHMKDWKAAVRTWEQRDKKTEPAKKMGGNTRNYSADYFAELERDALNY